MCMGIPMQIVELKGFMALCTGRGETRWIDCRLVGDVYPQDWVLVLVDAAREIIDANRAQEINSVLDMLASVMAGEFDEDADPGFVLPSSCSPLDFVSKKSEPQNHS